MKEKVPRSSDPRDVGDDDNDDDVREIICGDDDIRDVDEDAYAEVKEVMTTTEFMEKQVIIMIICVQTKHGLLLNCKMIKLESLCLSK